MYINLLEPVAYELGISWPVLDEDRITVCRTNDNGITLTTYQKNGHHVFTLSQSQATHLAALLSRAAEDSACNQAPRPHTTAPANPNPAARCGEKERA